MRKETNNHNINEADIFSLNRLSSNENFESGTTLTYGLAYEKQNNLNKIDFSIAQIIDEKKNTKYMPDSSGLDKRFSDFIGSINYQDNNNFKENYKYLIDQNFEETNYNDISVKYDANNINFNFNFFEDERKNYTKKKYLKSEISFQNGNNSLISFTNKRNLIKNSSEYYDLSYEYINDCLRAGLFIEESFIMIRKLNQKTHSCSLLL